MEISSQIIREEKLRKLLAVILIDMQEDFVKDLRAGEAKRIIPNQLEILKYCNQFSIPIVVLELNVQSYGKTNEILLNEAKKNHHFRLIGKEYDNGFFKTELDYHLKALGIKKLFIMGINANYCVKETARGAIDNGYKIMTSNEVISGQSGHSRYNSIDWFKSNGRCVDTVNEFAEEAIAVFEN